MKHSAMQVGIFVGEATRKHEIERDWKCSFWDMKTKPTLNRSVDGHRSIYNIV